MECSTSSVGTDLVLSEVTAHPVPASNVLNVEAAVGTQLTLVDMVGREVSTTLATGTLTTFDVSELTEGTYLLRAIADGQMWSTKVLLRH
jgi:hypothetical protein